MKKYIFLLLLSLITVTGCKTVKKSTASTECIQTEISQYPTATDLVIGEKVEKTVSWNFWTLQLLQPSFETRKNNLIADIVKSNGADVLVDVQTSFTKVMFGKRTLTVTGYLGTFKNFRKASIEDIEAYKYVKKNK